MSLGTVRGVTRLWTALYVVGLDPEAQRSRRDEVDSDLFDHRAAYSEMGVSDGVLARQVGSRLIRGVLSDILWRMDVDRESERVVLEGKTPALPWLLMAFVASVILYGSGIAVLGGVVPGHRTFFALPAVLGAGLLWLGLYLSSHAFAGGVLVALGTALVAWATWFTLVGPVLAVCAGVVGLRRALRIERLLRDLD